MLLFYITQRGALLWEGGFEQAPEGDERAGPVEGIPAEERAGAKTRSLCGFYVKAQRRLLPHSCMAHLLVLNLELYFTCWLPAWFRCTFVSHLFSEESMRISAIHGPVTGGKP